jgi:hypothetical protein
MALHTGLKSLDSLTALSSGCDLWIVADPSQSRWTRKIDWYLNFQLQRAQTHRSPGKSAELDRLLGSLELEAPIFELKSLAPLMVASSRLLPNRQTVLVPMPDDLDDWVKRCHELWKSMSCPTTRVFLPESVQPEAFCSRWAAKEASGFIEIVPDRELLNV